MSIQELKQEVNKAHAHAALAKAMVKEHLAKSRLLMNENDLHDIQEVSTKLESDASTISVYLSSFQRLGAGGHHFLSLPDGK